MGSQGVTFHPAVVTFQPLPQPKTVLDWEITERYKAELTYVYIIKSLVNIKRVLSSRKVASNRCSSDYFRKCSSKETAYITPVMASAKLGLHMTSQRRGVMPLVLFWNFSGHISKKSWNLTNTYTIDWYLCIWVYVGNIKKNASHTLTWELIPLPVRVETN